jgi:GMP synthase-like glutamine amidotransferase
MRLLVVQNDASDPIGPLGGWLRDAGLSLDVRDRGSLSDALDGYAGLVVLGGAMNVDDERLEPVRTLLVAALAAELPTLAVCLGAQLLAVAAGGRVGRNPDGPELGAQLIAKRANAATDPLFRDLPITPDVIQWHHDAVLELPPGAVLLASSPTCDVQALRVGRVAWGIQFHIETTPEVVRSWAAADAVALRGYEVERLLERSDAVHADIAEVWQPFAAMFAEVVRDPASVPATRPLRMATAEPVTDPAAIRAALAAELHAAHQPPSFDR